MPSFFADLKVSTDRALRLLESANPTASVYTIAFDAPEPGSSMITSDAI